MKSSEYREIIRKIVKAALKKTVPSLNNGKLKETADLIARNVHARMYGANVDNVDSPLWRASGEYQKPNVDAVELLSKGDDAL